MKVTNQAAFTAMAVNVVHVEQACIDMRKLLCEGSLLKGHTVKAAENLPDMEEALVLARQIKLHAEQLLNTLQRNRE